MDGWIKFCKQVDILQYWPATVNCDVGEIRVLPSCECCWKPCWQARSEFSTC